jgi:hypothetical protein
MIRDQDVVNKKVCTFQNILVCDTKKCKMFKAEH